MLNFKRSTDFPFSFLPFGYVEVTYPDESQWETQKFWEMVDDHIAILKEKYKDYDRHSVFDNNPHYRYFKKFKKTYVVMQQFESVILKDRPFPKYSRITAIPFLVELETHHLVGTHDADRTVGEILLFNPTEKENFIGLKGDECHCYPNDLTARDDLGIIFSEIAGADSRTNCHPDSRHVFYPVFSSYDGSEEIMDKDANLIMEYVKILCPTAKIEYHKV